MIFQPIGPYQLKLQEFHILSVHTYVLKYSVMRYRSVYVYTRFHSS